MQENLYTILGVTENATQEEIKKAYREKSKKLHPDVGGSEEDFKKVNEAYSVLSDDRKKQEYDFKKNNPNHGQGFNFGDMFDQMFNFGGNPFGKKRNAVQDKIIEIEINPIESYLGVEKNIQFVRNESCDGCKGKGGDKITCHACNGQGFFTRTVSNGMFNQIFRSVCNICGGNGNLLRNKCNLCQGGGIKVIMDSVKINLPHGSDDGQFLKIQGKGDFTQNGYGNLLLKVKMIQKDNFEKINNDLVYSKFLNLEDLKKEEFTVPHPAGDISVKFPEIFDTSIPLRVKGKGYRTDKGSGDLYVKMGVKFKR